MMIIIIILRIDYNLTPYNEFYYNIHVNNCLNIQMTF